MDTAMKHKLVQGIGFLVLTLILAGCGLRLVGRAEPGTGWYAGAFDSNGERIYFTATNEDGERIRSSGGPQMGMMMGGVFSCASCHGPDGRGGMHAMHMQVMDAPDIRWSVLSGESQTSDSEHDDGHEHDHEGYSIENFRMAVVEGSHPDGEPLSDDMPRWRMSDSDLEDLAEYLMTLP